MGIEEITSITRTTKIQAPCANKELTSIAPAQIQDKVTLSAAAIEEQKKALFVEMLKQMPEVTTLATVRRTIAEKIYKEITEN
jgi:hypothetical protein